MEELRKLYQTTKLVKTILQQDERARNSDSFLYLEVIRAVGKKYDLDVDSMSIPYFLLNMKELNFPSFETVRRTRQKLQSNNDELRSSTDVAKRKILKEKVYREYAKDRMIGL